MRWLTNEEMRESYKPPLSEKEKAARVLSIERQMKLWSQQRIECSQRREQYDIETTQFFADKNVRRFVMPLWQHLNQISFRFFGVKDTTLAEINDTFPSYARGHPEIRRSRMMMQANSTIPRKFCALTSSRVRTRRKLWSHAIVRSTFQRRL